MTNSYLDEGTREALRVLSYVTVQLIDGVEEEALIHRFQGQFVVPGVGIRQHLKELWAGNCLYRKEGKIFLKDQCNPIKLLGIA